MKVVYLLQILLYIMILLVYYVEQVVQVESMLMILINANYVFLHAQLVLIKKIVHHVLQIPGFMNKVVLLFALIPIIMIHQEIV